MRKITSIKELSAPVSVILEGEQGEKDVAMGVPVKINQNGITEIRSISFDKEEKELFKISAQTIRNNIQDG